MSDATNGETHLVPAPSNPGRLVPQNPTLHTGPVQPRSGQGGVAWTLLKALVRRWQQAVIFGLLAAIAVGAAVWFLLPPPMPGATAKLIVPMVMKGGMGEHPDPPLDRGTQIALVKSQLVLNAALRPAEIHDLPMLRALQQNGVDPLEWLAKNLVVDFSEGPEVLRISLSCEDPNQARLIVDAVKTCFLDEVNNRSAENRKKRIAWLKDSESGMTEDMRKKRAFINQYAQKNTGGTTDLKSIEFKAELIRDRMKHARNELSRSRSDISRFRAEESAFKNGRSGIIELPEEVLNNYVANDEAIKKSLEKQKQIKEFMEETRKRAIEPEKNESYQKAELDLKEHEKQHKDLIEEVKKSIRERAKSKSAAESASHLLLLRDQIAFSTSLEKFLESEIERLSKDVDDVHKGKQDLDPYLLDLKLFEELYTKVWNARSSLELEKDTPPRVFEMEKATIVRVDTERRKQFFAGIAALAALAGVGAMVGLKEVRMRRVDSADSLAQGLGLPIVGMIPRHPSRMSRTTGNVDGNSWQAGMIESINCTRTMLLHGEGLSSIKVVQITSPVSGEGKTTLSTHLALSVALAGRRTLLIDGDLRNPNAHRPFNLPDQPGLCELLRAEVSLAEALHPTTVAGLTVMPGGRWADGTQLALASTGLDGIFAQIRNDFDFIVVDSSPILPLTDPLLLARHADGVIVSLMQGVSRLPLVEEANQRMAVLGVRVLGAVLNGTAHRTYGYGSSYAPTVTA